MCRFCAPFGGTAVAQAASQGPGSDPDADTEGTSAPDRALAEAFSAVDRNTNWQQTGSLKLDFPTFHTEGIAFTDDHIFLPSVEILEPTVKFPTPQGGFDRTPGKGVGHLFVMDKDGRLQKDIVLGEGDMYHPGPRLFLGYAPGPARSLASPGGSSVSPAAPVRMNGRRHGGPGP